MILCLILPIISLKALASMCTCACVFMCVNVRVSTCVYVDVFINVFTCAHIDLAQEVEQLSCNRKVASLIPAPPSSVLMCP